GEVGGWGDKGTPVSETRAPWGAGGKKPLKEGAAESFPPQMIREHLLEASSRSGLQGTWVLRPAQGRKRYKVYTQPIDVQITRQIGDAVLSFGGIPLDQFLRSRFGIPLPTRAKAYLYEAIAGTKL